MYDLHCHSLLSDGALLPSELARRYEAKGYMAIAITEHVDTSNAKIVVPAIVGFCKKWPRNRIKVIPGVELTHIPLEHFNFLIKYVRKKGVKLIVVHGETPCEPVFKGTNRRAILSKVDILAHPGYISENEVKLAKKNGIYLEVTTRKGHRAANKHVIKLAKKYGVPIVINNDAHEPQDILSGSCVKHFARKVGLSKEQLAQAYKNSKKIISKFT